MQALFISLITSTLLALPSEVAQWFSLRLELQTGSVESGICLLPILLPLLLRLCASEVPLHIYILAQTITSGKNNASNHLLNKVRVVWEREATCRNSEMVEGENDREINSVGCNGNTCSGKYHILFNLRIQDTCILCRSPYSIIHCRLSERL